MASAISLAPGGTVVFDLLGVQSAAHGERGIARYILQLALHLNERHPGLITHFLVDETLQKPDSLLPLVEAGRVVARGRARDVLDISDGGVFFTTSPFESPGQPTPSVLPTWARGPHWKSVAIAYDFIPALFPNWYLRLERDRAWYHRRLELFRSFDAVLAISEATANDAAAVAGVAPSRVSVIGAGSDRQFRPPKRPTGEVFARTASTLPEIRPDFLLFPTGFDPRKGIDRMLAAYAKVPAEVRSAHQLVMVCSLTSSERDQIATQAAALGISENLLVTGFVADDLLVALYQCAGLVIFPSLYEGFGLPVLEARRCGAAVLCSDSSSLKEVQPDPRGRFDPLDIDGLAHRIQELFGDLEAIDELRSLPIPDFTWDRCADETARALVEVAAGRRRRARSPVHRVAVVTPLPPQSSGIATYSAHLLREMSATADVTAFVDAPADVESIDGIRIESLSNLSMIEDADGPFDDVLYMMGNSHFHVGALRSLRERRRRYPGAHRDSVFLHDVRLFGLYASMPSRELVGGTPGSHLHAMYPRRYEGFVREDEGISRELAARRGILMVREFADIARGLFVHSRFAADLVELDTGRRPEHVFDHPVPNSRESRRTTRPVICSFGIVDEVKQPELLIEAFGMVASQIPDAELRFVGKITPELRRKLQKVSREHSVDRKVVLTGGVPHEQWERLQKESALNVQLRRVTNGESSGSISESLAYGTPLIVTRLGAFAELPDNVAAKVSADVSAANLADMIVGIVSNRDRAEALSAGGRSYAGANAYASAAADLLSALRGL